MCYISKSIAVKSKNKHTTGKHRESENRRGAIMAIAPLMIIVLISVGIFVVDLGYLHATKSSLQNAADSASFTGALRLRVALGELEEEEEGDKKTKVVDEPQNLDVSFIAHLQALAIEFAELNHTAASGILGGSDIELGDWDFDTRVFTVAPPAEANAVRVLVRRGGSQSTSVSLFLAQFFGVASSEIEVTSVSAFNTINDPNGNTYYSMPCIVQ